jgi:hypothetical protein
MCCNSTRSSSYAAPLKTKLLSALPAVQFTSLLNRCFPTDTVLYILDSILASRHAVCKHLQHGIELHVFRAVLQQNNCCRSQWRLPVLMLVMRGSLLLLKLRRSQHQQQQQHVPAVCVC